MKRGIIQISILLMVANLLLGSVGFAYYEHLCHFSGKSEIQIDPPSKCCEKPTKNSKNDSKGQHLSASACCSIDLKVVQIDVSSPVHFWKAQFQSLSFILPDFSLSVPTFAVDEHVLSVQTNRWSILPSKPRLFLLFASILI